MVKILLILSVIVNIILIVKVLIQRKELNEFYEEDEEEYEKSVNEDNLDNDSNTDKINYIYKYIKSERESLLARIKDNNLSYQTEYINLKKQINKKDEVIKKQEEQIQNLLTEISSLQTIKEQETKEEIKIEEKTKKTTRRKSETQEKENTENIKENDSSNKNNSEEDLLSLLFEKEENKKVDSKLAKMQKGELLNYFTNLFNTLRNGNPADKEVQETYTNAIKDIRDYEEMKQMFTGLVTEEGKLKMRSLMNYIDQLQM